MKRYLSKNFASKDEATKAWEKLPNKKNAFLSFGKYERKMGFAEIKIAFMVDGSSEIEGLDDLKLEEVSFLEYYRG